MVFLGGYSVVLGQVGFLMGFPSRSTWDVCKLRDNKRFVCRHASAKVNSAAGFSGFRMATLLFATGGVDLDIDRILLLADNL